MSSIGSPKKSYALRIHRQHQVVASELAPPLARNSSNPDDAGNETIRTTYTWEHPTGSLAQ